MKRDDGMIASVMLAEQKGLFRLACYKLGNPDDAADIVQDLFLKVWQRCDIATITDVRNYLYRSLLNACMSHYRLSTKAEFVEIDTEIPEPDDNGDDFHREYRRIAALLHAIPEEQAEVISLHTIGGKSFSEIALILGVPVSTVKSRFKYGIDKIRERINNKNSSGYGLQ